MTMFLRLAQAVVIAAIVGGLGAVSVAKAQTGNPPPDGPPSISLTTPDPALGVTIYFAATAPERTSKKFDIRVQVLCYSQVDDVLIYGEAGPWDLGFLLGGGSSDWLNDRPTEAVHCVATEYYWSKVHGLQTFNWLAETEFDAAGQ